MLIRRQVCNCGGLCDSGLACPMPKTIEVDEPDDPACAPASPLERIAALRGRVAARQQEENDRKERRRQQIVAAQAAGREMLKALAPLAELPALVDNPGDDHAVRPLLPGKLLLHDVMGEHGADVQLIVRTPGGYDDVALMLVQTRFHLALDRVVYVHDDDIVDAVQALDLFAAAAESVFDLDAKERAAEASQKAQQRAARAAAAETAMDAQADDGQLPF